MCAFILVKIIITRYKLKLKETDQGAKMAKRKKCGRDTKGRFLPLRKTKRKRKRKRRKRRRGRRGRKRGRKRRRTAVPPHECVLPIGMIKNLGKKIKKNAKYNFNL